MDDLNNIIEDLIDHIGVLKELGQRTVQVEPQVVRDILAAKKPKREQPQSSVTQNRPENREPLSTTVLQSSKPLSLAERETAMRQLRTSMDHCFDCELCKHRKAPVIGEGNLNSPDVMFVGAAPDTEDDRRAGPFSGAAGDLLTKMIEAMGYKREDVFLTNICKCSTPNNRAPTMSEMVSCSHFFEEQVKIVRPRVIVVLGEHANKGLFHNQRTASQPQGTWTKYHGIPVMPTFHPQYILRFSNDTEGHQKDLKRSVWSALKGVMLLLKK